VPEHVANEGHEAVGACGRRRAASQRTGVRSAVDSARTDPRQDLQQAGQRERQDVGPRSVQRAPLRVHRQTRRSGEDPGVASRRLSVALQPTVFTLHLLRFDLSTLMLISVITYYRRSVGESIPSAAVLHRATRRLLVEPSVAVVRMRPDDAVFGSEVYDVVSTLSGAGALRDVLKRSSQAWYSVAGHVSASFCDTGPGFLERQGSRSVRWLLLSELFERFVKKSPIRVMARVAERRTSSSAYGADIFSRSRRGPCHPLVGRTCPGVGTGRLGRGSVRLRIRGGRHAFPIRRLDIRRRSPRMGRHPFRTGSRFPPSGTASLGTQSDSLPVG